MRLRRVKFRDVVPINGDERSFAQSGPSVSIEEDGAWIVVKTADVTLHVPMTNVAWVERADSVPRVVVAAPIAKRR